VIFFSRLEFVPAQINGQKNTIAARDRGLWVGCTAVLLYCCRVPYYCTTVVQLIENIFKIFFHRAHTTGDQFFHHRSEGWEQVIYTLVPPFLSVYLLCWKMLYKKMIFYFLFLCLIFCGCCSPLKPGLRPNTTTMYGR